MHARRIVVYQLGLCYLVYSLNPQSMNYCICLDVFSTVCLEVSDVTLFVFINDMNIYYY